MSQPPIKQQNTASLREQRYCTSRLAFPSVWNPELPLFSCQQVAAWADPCR
eukprot:COSAG03_NODE_26473_length_259_cov_0.587500_1_plen_50_part_01